MVNAWADFATRLRPYADGSRMFRRYFHFALPEPFQQQYQLGPKALRKYLSGKAGKALADINRAEFGGEWKPSRGLPMEWFDAKQNKHIQQQRMRCIATMQELARRWAKRKVHIPEMCALCRRKGRLAVDDRTHTWLCPETRPEVHDLLTELVKWLEANWYRSRQTGRQIQSEVWSAMHMIIWSMATTTEAIKTEKMPKGDKNSMAVRFISKVIDASIKIYEIRAKKREEVFREERGTSKTLRQMMMEALEDGEWEAERGTDEGDEQGEEDDTDEGGWSTEDSHVEDDQREERASGSEWELQEDHDMLDGSESDDSAAEDHHEGHECRLEASTRRQDQVTQQPSKYPPYDRGAKPEFRVR